MDWLQFISSLAWPLVVLCLLLRHRPAINSILVSIHKAIDRIRKLWGVELFALLEHKKESLEGEARRLSDEAAVEPDPEKRKEMIAQIITDVSTATMATTGVFCESGGDPKAILKVAGTIPEWTRRAMFHTHDWETTHIPKDWQQPHNTDEKKKEKGE